jgi:VWFA-related protein
MTMKCPRKITLLLFCPFLLFLNQLLFSQAPASPPAKPPTTAQSPNPTSDSQGKISTTTTLVIVPVTVKDKSGNLVPGLQREDFRILEDNIEQVISSFTAEAFPLSIVVMIDDNLNQKDAEQVEASLPAIVAGLSLRDEATICRFDQYVEEGLGFTKDQDMLLTRLKRTQLSSKSAVAPPGGPFNGPSLNDAPAPGAPMTSPSLRSIERQSTKALDDAVYAGAQLLRDRPKGRRKIVLLISDGKNGAKFNKHSYAETRAELLRYDISVYSVAVGSAYFDRKFNRLVQYAHETGGDRYFGAKAQTFEEFYSQLTDEARNQYTLSYSPKGSPGIGYHSIEVRVRQEGLSILAREGYYGGAVTTEPAK